MKQINSKKSGSKNYVKWLFLASACFTFGALSAGASEVATDGNSFLAPVASEVVSPASCVKGGGCVCGFKLTSWCRGGSHAGADIKGGASDAQLCDEVKTRGYCADE